MNKTYRFSQVVLITTALVSLCLVGCGGPAQYFLIGHDKAAAADGVVEVEKIEGGNSMVTITLKHLLPPERVDSSAKTFVAWFYIPGKEAPIKAGTLGYSAETREGKLMATTPEKKFTIKVTAEQSANVTAPSDHVVAKQRVK